jgi:hypothetical protein
MARGPFPQALNCQDYYQICWYDRCRITSVFSGVIMLNQQDRLPRLPPDRCPHASGRAGGFERCPAFQPVVERPILVGMPGLDFLTQEPSALVTCAHLRVGLAGDGRYYPSCRLGTPAARWRYATSQPA